MNYRKAAKRLGQEFVDHPLNFITEVDLQVRLMQLLQRELKDENTLQAEVKDTNIPGSARSYKSSYKRSIEEKLGERETLGRVHTEVSVKQGNRFDVVVFQDEISNPVQWVRTGSKRFNEDDLEAVFEMKYIKNKNYFPFEWHINSEKILETTNKELRKQLNKTENKIQGDLTELKNLPDYVDTYFLLFSNNNYLFHGNLSKKEKEEKTKIRVGEVAQNWLVDESRFTSILYTHPMNSIWL